MPKHVIVIISEEALKLSQQALKIFRTELSDHANTASVLMTIGGTYEEWRPAGLHLFHLPIRELPSCIRASAGQFFNTRTAPW